MTRTILAYLDPGSSSMIVQMLLGGFAAAGVALKLYWRRIKRFLRIGGRADADQPVEAPAARSATTTPSNGTGTDGDAVEREPVESTKR